MTQFQPVHNVQCVSNALFSPTSGWQSRENPLHLCILWLLPSKNLLDQDVTAHWQHDYGPRFRFILNCQVRSVQEFIDLMRRKEEKRKQSWICGESKGNKGSFWIWWTHIIPSCLFVIQLKVQAEHTDLIGSLGNNPSISLIMSRLESNWITFTSHSSLSTHSRSPGKPSSFTQPLLHLLCWWESNRFDNPVDQE